MESRERLSRRGLLDWFAHFKVRADGTGETAQLRLESDEDLVKIVTIHRAKGLEFPVVFCPFAWSGHAPDGKVKTAEYYDRAAKSTGFGFAAIGERTRRPSGRRLRR